MCRVGQVRLSVRVSYEERCVVVSLLCGVWQVRPSMCVCHVGQVRLSVRVSYEECCVVVSLLESECVVLGRSVCVCVCHTRNSE